MSIDVKFLPKEFSEHVINLVLSARVRIVICTLYIKNELFINRLLGIIDKKLELEPNLNVEIFVDGWSNTEWVTDKYRNLTTKITKIKVKRFFPLSVFHAKGWVIDDELIYSSVNLTDDYFCGKEKFRQDRYYTIYNKVLCDDFVSSLNEIKVQSGKVTLNHSVCKRFIMDDSDLIGSFFGNGHDSCQSRLFNKLCKEARNNIFISTPYFNLDVKNEELLRELIKQGVKVYVVVGGYSDRISGWSESIISNLIKSTYMYRLYEFTNTLGNEMNNDIFLYEWKIENGSYHVKNLLIDDEVSLLTSSNLNARSHFLDLENGFIIKNNSGSGILRNERMYILDKSIKIKSSNYWLTKIPKKYLFIIKILKAIGLYRIALKSL